MNLKKGMKTDDHGLSSSITNFKQSLATYQTANFGPLSFRNNLFPAVSSPSVAVVGDLPISTIESDSPVLFQDSSAALSGLLCPYCSSV